MTRKLFDAIGEIDGVAFRPGICGTVRDMFLVTLINVQSIDTVHASRLKVPLAAKDNTVLVVLPHTLHTGGASEVDVSIWSVETTSIVWSYRDTKGFGG